MKVRHSGLRDRFELALETHGKVARRLGPEHHRRQTRAGRMRFLVQVLVLITRCPIHEGHWATWARICDGWPTLQYSVAYLTVRIDFGRQRLPTKRQVVVRGSRMPYMCMAWPSRSRADMAEGLCILTSSYRTNHYGQFQKEVIVSEGSSRKRTSCIDRRPETREHVDVSSPLLRHLEIGSRLVDLEFPAEWYCY